MRSACCSRLRSARSASSSPSRGVDGVDLGELEPVEILLPRLLSHLLLEMLLPVPRVPPGAHQMRHALSLRLALAEAVEQAELLLGLEQPLMLVLAVELHEVLAEPLQEPDRRRRVVDVDPVPSGAGDLSLHDELPLTRGVAGLVENGGQRAPAIDVEHRLDGGQILAGADQVGVGARAEHEQDGVDQNGFARAGLPREHVEAGREWHRDLLDHGQVSDPELSQHGGFRHATAKGEAGSTVSSARRVDPEAVRNPLSARPT